MNIDDIITSLLNGKPAKEVLEGKSDDIVRSPVQPFPGRTCDFCGGDRKGLFHYGTRIDGGDEIDGHPGVFCSDSCFKRDKKFQSGPDAHRL